jgi:hypothetical protein
MKITRIKINELKEGDLFSFRTYTRPIWWRFIKLKDSILTYEEIKSKFKHHTRIELFPIVLKKNKDNGQKE